MNDLKKENSGQNRSRYPLSIAVSRLSENYSDWLQKLQSGLRITDFGDSDPGRFSREIQFYSGLLLTGGGDIHPGMYGNADDQGQCRNIDVKRDELEREMIRAALFLDLPILAICRGLQMLNVVNGGSLFTDIPAFFPNAIPHKDHDDVFHSVTIVPGSMLYRITQSKSAVVNSSHHQAVDRLADGMQVTAFSGDGLAEAIEFTGNHRTFCLAVQWHPERMNIDNPLSGKLGMAFIREL